MKVVFDKLAVKELEDAVEYYEVQKKGLGRTFEKEIKRSLNIMKQFPEIGSIEMGDVRRFFLHKFPYKICIPLKASTYK